MGADQIKQSETFTRWSDLALKDPFPLSHYLQGREENCIGHSHEKSQWNPSEPRHSAHRHSIIQNLCQGKQRVVLPWHALCPHIQKMEDTFKPNKKSCAAA